MRPTREFSNKLYPAEPDRSSSSQWLFVSTFNPPDVRSIQKELKQQGVAFVLEADEATDGAAHATLLDPDGNAILFDQFH